LVRGNDDDALPASDDEEQDDGGDETKAALAAFGLAAVDEPSTRQQRVFYLWREHEEAVRVFLACRTQWRVGFDEPTGLDYAGVESLIRMRRLVQRPRLPEVLAELQILEDETLAEWRRQRKASDRSAR
jgi:hypothetical protein